MSDSRCEGALVDLAVAHQYRRPALQHAGQPRERKSTRTTSQLMASRLKAPITPPVTELSSPMMAFCTVFESESSTTRSKGFKLGQFPLAEEAQQQHQHQVDDHRAEQLLQDRKRQLKHVVEDQ